ncbi:unnamed protein product, partial [Mesorhabditis spiculigera]
MHDGGRFGNKLQHVTRHLVFHCKKTVIRFGQRRLKKWTKFPIERARTALQIAEEASAIPSFELQSIGYLAADHEILSHALSSVAPLSPPQLSLHKSPSASTTEQQPKTRLTDLPEQCIFQIVHYLDVHQYEARGFEIFVQSGCMGSVTVVAKYVKLEQLYKRGQLIPTDLTFGGGEFTRGKSYAGVDLRCFTEAAFIRYISQFSPTLNSVHLQTTSASPPRLLALLANVREFGYVYERPALKYYFDDFKKIVEGWRHDSLSHATILYIRRPTDLPQRYLELSPSRVLFAADGTLQQLVFAHQSLLGEEFTVYF